MHLLRLCTAACCLLSGGNVALASQRPTCDAIELVIPASTPHYNALVCAGLDQMARGQHAEAASTFEDALAETLFELPNFKLLPHLALAYARAGNAPKARENIQKAELALAILIGSVKCDESSSAFRLNVPSQFRAMSIASVEEVHGRMCGAMYDAMYENKSLAKVVRDAELIQIYMLARSEIEAK